MKEVSVSVEEVATVSRAVSSLSIEASIASSFLQARSDSAKTAAMQVSFVTAFSWDMNITASGLGLFLTTVWKFVFRRVLGGHLFDSNQPS